MRLFGLIALLLCAAGAAPAGTLSIIGYDRWTTVAYVFDGDTFRTEAGEKVRLLGINTPEVAHDSEPGEPLGMDAARMLSELIGAKGIIYGPSRIARAEMFGRKIGCTHISGLCLRHFGLIVSRKGSGMSY